MSVRTQGHPVSLRQWQDTWVSFMSHAISSAERKLRAHAAVIRMWQRPYFTRHEIQLVANIRTRIFMQFLFHIPRVQIHCQQKQHFVAFCTCQRRVFIKNESRSRN